MIFKLHNLLPFPSNEPKALQLEQKSTRSDTYQKLTTQIYYIYIYLLTYLLIFLSTYSR